MIISAVVRRVWRSGTTSQLPDFTRDLLFENGSVDVGRYPQGPFVVATEHHPVGVQIVLDGIALPKELGVRHHAVETTSFESDDVLDERAHPVAGTDRNRALRHDHVIVVQVLRNRTGNGSNGAHFRMAVRPRRGADADEDDVGLVHRQRRNRR